MAMVQQQTEDDINQNGEIQDGSPGSGCSEEPNSSRSSSQNSSRRSTPGPLPQFQYSKEALMELSRTPLSLRRPQCLDLSHNNPNGKWDPEKWFVNKRGERPLQLEDGRVPKRDRSDNDVLLSHKRRTSDPRERVREEKDEIILSPQRRSFGTGCHVTPAYSKRPGSPTDLRDIDSFRDTRRIGSGRIMGRDRDQREWERDHRDYYGNTRNDRRDRYDQDDNEKDNRRYGSRYIRNERRVRGHDRIHEEEPEWFSGGPTSQSETIELVGFDDPSNNVESKPKSKKGAKKSRDNSRRQSLKSEEGEITETVSVTSDKNDKENEVPKEVTTDVESTKSKSPEVVAPVMENDQQTSNANNFDLTDLFRMDWIPELLPRDSPTESSRFTQWFHRESPVPEGSANNSRRSSLQDELFSHVLSGIGEPNLLIPSPSPDCSDAYFAPISPAIHTPPIPPPHPANDDSPNIMDMLHSVGDRPSVMTADKCQLPHNDMPPNSKSIKELEADLKRIVLGNSQRPEPEGPSAFDKLLQHMSDAPSSAISMGPMDKSKVLQEDDLLHDIMGPRPPSPMQSRISQNRLDFHNMSNMNANMSMNHIQQPRQIPPSELYNKILQQQQHQQELQQQFELQQQQAKQMQQAQQQMMQPPKSNNTSQNMSLDMLTKMLDAQSHGNMNNAMNSGLHHSNAMCFNRTDNQPISVLQQKHRMEMMMSILKQQQQQQHQQQQQQHHQVVNPPPPPVIHQPKCQNFKENMLGPTPQTLGLPNITADISPRQSPLPNDVPGSSLHPQGRIPSPLVFGQQPPALSHAPAPIHAGHLAQAMAQNQPNPNTLQVQQNPLVLQRVPSPQELAVHTQSILQNALIKRKLEEQKENFRKRQEAQRANSPGGPNTKSGSSSSPLKGLSPTIAFTPTAVMRKMHAERNENTPLKPDIGQIENGKLAGFTEDCQDDSQQNIMKQNILVTVSSAPENAINGGIRNENIVTQPKNINMQQQRSLYGQGTIIQPRPHPQAVASSIMNSFPSQGRPIVKGSNGQNINAIGDGSRAITGIKGGMPNKLFPPTNNQYNNIHPDREPTIDVIKFVEQQRLMQQHKPMNLLGQRRQAASPMPPVHAAAAFAFGPRAHHPVTTPAAAANLVRPLNLGPAAVAAAAPTNINFPLLRTMIQANPAIRTAQTCSLNQLRALSQIAALQQFQRGGMPENRPIQAANRNFHPMAFQQLLMNTQNQVPTAATQSSVVDMTGAHGDGKHAHLMPGTASTNRQSPVNLTKWFGNDVLKQKMPDMPPVSHQKALRLEDIERQQHSTIVHN